MITTVIPSIGRETLYTRAIPSVQAQTGDWECIVVGDGVELEPVDDPRFRFLVCHGAKVPHQPINGWRTGGMWAFNLGLDHARGEWVSYLADDDAYRPNHHSDLIDNIRDADVVFGATDAHHPEMRLSRLGTHWPPEPFDICQGSYILRASLGFRADWRCIRKRVSWDADWWERIIASRARFTKVSTIVHDYYPDVDNFARFVVR